MSLSAMESTSQPVEKSAENNGASVESASLAYSKDAPKDLSSCSSTADQHLNGATIGDDYIDFGPGEGGKNLYENNRLAETTVTDKSGTSHYRYDEDGTKHYSHRNPQGRLVEESMTRPDESGVARQYGEDNSRKHITWDKNGNQYTETYNDKGRLTETTTREGGTTSRIRYDEDGTKHYSHKDSNGRVFEESMTRPDGSGTARQYGKYDYRKAIDWDKNGNQTTRTYQGNVLTDTNSRRR